MATTRYTHSLLKTKQNNQFRPRRTHNSERHHNRIYTKAINVIRDLIAFNSMPIAF